MEEPLSLLLLEREGGGGLLNNVSIRECLLKIGFN
jgi:hypothetical protein